MANGTNLFFISPLPDAPHGGKLAQNEEGTGNSLVNFNLVDYTDWKIKKKKTHFMLHLKVSGPAVYVD